MKKVDRLRERGVHNSHGLLEKGDYLVTFTSYHGQGRFPTYYGWYLTKKGFAFKSASHWDRGSLQLRGRGQDGTPPPAGGLTLLNLADRDEALRHAARVTGHREWARDPYGGWQPAAQLAARLAAHGIADSRAKVVAV